LEVRVNMRESTVSKSGEGPDGSPRGRTARYDRILERARQGGGLCSDDIRFLLAQTDPVRVGRLFAAARRLRQEHFDDRVFLYGFVYFSTFCRNDCAFCQHRRSNSAGQRHRKTAAGITGAARLLADEGVHLIDLTMGEDPRYFEDQPSGFDRLAEKIRGVKSETGLPVMISPGVLPREALRQMAHAGADWYACYQETHNPGLFAALRPHQGYLERRQAKVDAAGAGLLVEEGILCGVGETLSDIAESIAEMGELGADQVRVMSFVPQPGTPLAGRPAPDALRELLIIAVMRLAFPDRLIPASLDVEGLDGLRSRMDAGANVVTSLIAPNAGLTGVASLTRDIDASRRMPAAVNSVLARCGLTTAGRDDYRTWMRERRRAGASAKNR
jgi:methylornithine synthase